MLDNSRKVLGSSTHLVKKGSAAKHTQSRSSDVDFMQTGPTVTRKQRSNLVKEIQADPRLKGRISSVRAKTNSIQLRGIGKNPDLDIGVAFFVPTFELEFPKFVLSLP